MKSLCVIFDRIFDLNGQLNYPVSPDPQRPWTPEVFGDAMMVNGKVLPLSGSRASHVPLSYS